MHSVVKLGYVTALSNYIISTLYKDYGALKSLSSIVITWGHVSGHIMITPRFGTCEVIIGDYFLLF